MSNFRPLVHPLMTEVYGFILAGIIPPFDTKT